MKKVKNLSGKELSYFSESFKNFLKHKFKEAKEVSKHSDLEDFDDRRMRTSKILYYKDVGEPLRSHNYIDRLNLHVDSISNGWHPAECKAAGEDLGYIRLTFQPVSVFYFLEDYSSLDTMIDLLYDNLSLKKTVVDFVEKEFELGGLMKKLKFHEKFVESLIDWYQRSTKVDFHYIDTFVEFRPLFDSIMINAKVYFNSNLTSK